MFRSRQYAVFLLLVALFFSLFARLFFLQIFGFRTFDEMASGQHNMVLKLEPRRGTIYDRYMEPLAINLDVPSVYCDPRGVADKERTADILSNILHVNRASLLEKLKKDRSFIWVKRKIDQGSAADLAKLKLSGVYFQTESKRHYSNDNMASQVLGCVGMDNEGLEGLELLYNAKLQGKPGWRQMIRDAKRKAVLSNDRESMPPQNGYNLVLTIDGVVQCIAEDEIAAMVDKFNASSASAVVMDPYTGKVLALVNYPGYNPNKFSTAPKHLMKDEAVCSVFEPGSVFKIVTASAALDTGKIDPEDIFDCEMGEWEVARRTLHDFHPYGKIPFREVIAKSSNIGTVKAAQKIGPEVLYDYIKRFGFGDKTGIDLPGEVPGVNRPTFAWSRSDISTIPIGQGVAVTAMQLAAAVGSIANGGYLMKPYVVDKITTPEGRTYKKYQPLMKRRVLKESTCREMKDIMALVVSDGTGAPAKSKLFELCGKTGTAQVPSPGGGYYPNKYIATFIGFAPKEDPRIVIVITARNPHPIHFGGNVAGPAFRRIAERTLEYLGTSGRTPPAGEDI